MARRPPSHRCRLSRAQARTWPAPISQQRAPLEPWRQSSSGDGARQQDKRSAVRPPARGGCAMNGTAMAARGRSAAPRSPLRGWPTPNCLGRARLGGLAHIGRSRCPFITAARGGGSTNSTIDNGRVRISLRSLRNRPPPALDHRHGGRPDVTMATSCYAERTASTTRRRMPFGAGDLSPAARAPSATRFAIDEIQTARPRGGRLSANRTGQQTAPLQNGGARREWIPKQKSRAGQWATHITLNKARESCRPTGADIQGDCRRVHVAGLKLCLGLLTCSVRRLKQTAHGRLPRPRLARMRPRSDPSAGKPRTPTTADRSRPRPRPSAPKPRLQTATSPIAGNNHKTSTTGSPRRARSATCSCSSQEGRGSPGPTLRDPPAPAFCAPARLPPSAPICTPAGRSGQVGKPFGRKSAFQPLGRANAIAPNTTRGRPPTGEWTSKAGTSLPKPKKSAVGTRVARRPTNQNQRGQRRAREAVSCPKGPTPTCPQPKPHTPRRVKVVRPRAGGTGSVHAIAACNRHEDIHEGQQGGLAKDR